MSESLAQIVEEKGLGSIQPVEFREMLLVRMAGLEYETKNYWNVVRMFEEEWSYKTMTPTLRMFRGFALMQLGRWREALISLSDVIATRDQPSHAMQSPDVHTGRIEHAMGVCYRHLNQPELARNAYLAGLKISPDDERIKGDLASLNMENPNMHTGPQALGMATTPEAELDTLKRLNGEFGERLAQELDRSIKGNVRLSIALSSIKEAGHGESDWARKMVERINQIQ